MKNTGRESKKRILYVITLGELGGAQKYIQNLSSAFKKEFDITIAAGGDNTALADWAKDQNIPILPLPSLGRSLAFGFLPSPRDIRALFALARRIHAGGYSIVHLNSSKAGFLGAIAGRIAKTPKIVFTAHGWVFNEPSNIRKRHWLWRMLSKISAKFQDHIICVSDYDLLQAVRYRIASPRKLVAIPNGIDIKKISRLPRAKSRKFIGEKIGAQKDDKMVGAIANAYPAKDLASMVRAVKHTEDPQIKLVIIGDGPERPRLESIISAEGLRGRVFLLGRMENAVQYIKAFDAYVITSVKEGMPFAALEAMAAGVPVLSTAVGGLRELFWGGESSAAIEIPVANPAAVGAELSTLFANADRLTTLAQNAKERVAALFSEDTMIEKTRWVYEV